MLQEKRAARADALWFLLAALIILATLSVPNWIGKNAENDEFAFRGSYADLTDLAANMSMMRSGALGEWLYKMRFTNEAHPPAFLRMFYVLLGHFSGWTGLSVETVHELARWLFGLAALYAIYVLCKTVFPNLRLARAAFLLAALGAGAGWLQLLAGAPMQPVSPIDFWLIDAYVFFSVSLFPAFSYSLILMALALKLFMDDLDRPSWKRIAAICALALACQITNPIAFSVVDLAFVGAVGLQWLRDKRFNGRQFAALAVIAVAQIPLLAYNYAVLMTHPVWNVYTAQNQTPSPPPIFYFWGFAPFWLLALPGAFFALKRRDAIGGALLAWVIGAFTFAYLPLAIQRRFLLGITIPLGILAVIGLDGILGLASKKIAARKNIFLTAYVAVALISTAYFLLGSGMFLQTLPENRFYPRETQQALVWLNRNAQPNDFVLSSLETGELVAQYTDLRVYLGHQIETLYYGRKAGEVARFFNGQADPRWLAQTSAAWVFYGPYEKRLSAEGKFAFPQGEIAYQSENIVIYRVAPR